MPYTLRPAPLDELASLRRRYLASVTAPLDGMWQTFVELADAYEILETGARVGYCAVDSQRRLLQLYAPDATRPRVLFRQLLAQLELAGAVVATCEPETLALCLDHELDALSVNAILYYAPPTTPQAEPAPPRGCDFRLVEASELPAAVDFGVASLGAERAWLATYYRGLIARRELYGLWRGETWVACGELRPSPLQPPYADVGMVVAPAERGQGLAAAVLRLLRRECARLGLQAICSTERSNLAAQVAIERAGFRSRDRLLNVSFKTL